MGAARSLVAVSAASNRTKGDKDPAQWLPPLEKADCQYAADWVGDKLRWKLSADTAEKKALDKQAGACPHTTVTSTPAP
ncbi:hypothetical protein ACFV3R_33045 [Streptomyces sp. NPDC059740]|uniref:hypothetical protein n=1 Tax=Streptomyces sp. NPDC059740 TaxID=3346926 RepID=UPI0036688E68